MLQCSGNNTTDATIAGYHCYRRRSSGQILYIACSGPKKKSMRHPFFWCCIGIDAPNIVVFQLISFHRCLRFAGIMPFIGRLLEPNEFENSYILLSRFWFSFFSFINVYVVITCSLLVWHVFFCFFKLTTKTTMIIWIISQFVPFILAYWSLYCSYFIRCPKKTVRHLKI